MNFFLPKHFQYDYVNKQTRIQDFEGFDSAKTNIQKQDEKNNKIPIFATLSILHCKAVAGLSGLKKQVQQPDFPLSKADLMPDTFLTTLIFEKNIKIINFKI